jgi:hypothetical protein
VDIYKNNTPFLERTKPWIGSLILLPVMIYYVFNMGEFTFIDYLNLLIHEGGHGIFSFFGRYIYTLGGTMMQIIIPCLFIFYFYSHRKRIGIQISLIWLGENLMNISAYAADARARLLPLLGGNKVYHDWNYLLREINLLNFDKEIGAAFYTFGIIVFIISLLMPLILKNEELIDLNLEV